YELRRGTWRPLRARRPLVALAVCTGVAVLLCAHTAMARVWHVGTFEGKRSQGSLQKAVKAASPGDWILIAPGDYKETGDHLSLGASRGRAGAGVLVEKSGIHIRGMNRNGVIIDGTKKRTPTCSSNP